MAEAMRANVAVLLKGIDRYNPENLATLEKYVDQQVRENTYDLEANLAVLKLYQFNPMYFQTSVTAQILLKALTNLPHTDFVLCKCLIEASRQEEETIVRIVQLANNLEMCYFNLFWEHLNDYFDLTRGIVGFEDSIRKFICHVVSITYQTINKDQLSEFLGTPPEAQLKNWIAKYGWQDYGNGQVYIQNQEDNIKTKNITEKITFETVAGIMAKGPPVVPR